VLGLGAGWHQPEFDAFGLPFDHRVSRFDEATQVITGLLRDGITHLAIGRKAAGEVTFLNLAEIGIPVLPEFLAPKRWSF
jgi:alkanesulfonate monooxygenase SsuD/methylene tetrahydromethanopterin reductase-like flavin-dependent oxidoreductase (luciferase family)